MSTVTTAGAPLMRRARRGPLTLARAGFGDLTGRWRLIRHLVKADLARTHADTALGQAWWLLDPILQLAVYYFLFAIVFQRKVEDFLLFLFSAILPWKWFASSLNAGMLSVVSRQNLIRQIQFPKIVLPAAATFAQLVSFAVGLIALGLLFIPYMHRLSPWVLTIPVIAAVQLLFTLAVAILLAAANAFYRDVANVMEHLVRLWFYMSPGLYAVSEINSRVLRELIGLNPFTTLFNSYRAVTWGTDTVSHGTAPDFAALGILAVVSAALLAFAVVVFKRVEPAFARIL